MPKYTKRVLLQHVRCAECGVPMVERVGKKGEFYGCSRFPLCIGTRPKGEGTDSYTALLRVAYTKAIRFLGSPKFMGIHTAARWMAEQALGRELTDDEFSENKLQHMVNEHLERGIESANGWLYEQGEVVDFLVNAHEERFAHIQANLKFDTTAQQIMSMAKPEIVRRYDSSQLMQLEAHLATEWNKDGTYCPRCGGWSSMNQQETAPFSWDDLFSDESKLTSFECAQCGLFHRRDRAKGEATEFIYDKDKDDPLRAPGIEFKAHKPRKDDE